MGQFWRMLSQHDFSVADLKIIHMNGSLILNMNRMIRANTDPDFFIGIFRWVRAMTNISSA
ncbi:hypothetical protein C2134_18485 [Chromobacterium sinusclupearum]|uniref:Uncharacterized protein n=1 Tax=Chromobacterium sinusclupearum TaxID=2077146 RepID=A0A2K4MJD5_9NEIS|nr:hypothetical protein C2134_18485 [Chromobacterium sinusclupearum]